MTETRKKKVCRRVVIWIDVGENPLKISCRADEATVLRMPYGASGTLDSESIVHKQYSRVPGVPTLRNFAVLGPFPAENMEYYRVRGFRLPKTSSVS